MKQAAIYERILGFQAAETFFVSASVPSCASCYAHSADQLYPQARYWFVLMTPLLGTY